MIDSEERNYFHLVRHTRLLEEIVAATRLAVLISVIGNITLVILLSVSVLK